MTAAARKSCRIQNAESWAKDMPPIHLKAWRDLTMIEIVDMKRSIAECEADHAANVEKGILSPYPGVSYDEFKWPEDLDTTEELLIAANMALRIQKRAAAAKRVPKFTMVTRAMKRAREESD